MKLYLSFQDDAIKFAQITKKKYNQERRLIEKVLNLENTITVRDLCTQLGIEKVIPIATGLHRKCCEILQKSNMDSNHPQYLAMAVYQAAKHMKVSVSKVQLRESSQMTGPQWTKLEQLWQKWAISVDQHNTKTKTNSTLIQEGIKWFFFCKDILVLNSVQHPNTSVMSVTIQQYFLLRTLA